MDERKPGVKSDLEADASSAKEELGSDSGFHSVAVAESQAGGPGVPPDDLPDDALAKRIDPAADVPFKAKLLSVSGNSPKDQPKAPAANAGEAEPAKDAPALQLPAGSPRELQVGQLISERYRVLDLIGSGGMGSVYRVEQIFLHKQLALKTLSPSTSLNELSWPRFQKEARAASLFDHANLIKVHDFGLIGNMQPFFVMDFFDGETLSKRLRRDGPLSLEMALTIFIQACDGLAHAHKQGVVHRDIKPGNIMLSWGGNCDAQKVKIVDFGIAKVVNAESDQVLALTRTGEIFGTPFYMSPEQCLGRELDHRADIYSLGCVIFEALSGTAPFIGDTALSIMMKHQAERPPTLKEATLGKDFPPGIESIIARMIEKNPQDRYQNLFDVARDLYRVKRGESIEGKPSRQTASALGRSNAYSGAALAAVAVIFAAMIFVAGRITAPPAPHTVSEHERVPAPLHEEEKEPPVLPPKEIPFYSSWTPENPTTRYFHFPAKSLGAITELSDKPQVFADDSSMRRIKAPNAQNTLIMEHFEPFGLLLSNVFIEHPDILDRFRPDEICELSFSQLECSVFMNDDYLQHVKKLKSLRRISLFNCQAITGKGLMCLNSLPNLTEINAAGVRHLSADGLAHLIYLKRLHGLHVERIKHPSIALQAMQGSTALKILEFRQSGIEDQDCQLIASLSNLETLDLCNNQLHDAGLKYLVKLQKLTSLNVHKNKITPASIDTFKHFTKLRRLVIETDKWSDTDRARLQSVLKTCRIYDTPPDSTGNAKIDGIILH